MCRGECVLLWLAEQETFPSLFWLVISLVLVPTAIHGNFVVLPSSLIKGIRRLLFSYCRKTCQQWVAAVEQERYVCEW